MKNVLCHCVRKWRVLANPVTYRYKNFDLPHYGAPICFCLVHVYSSCCFRPCARLSAVKLCLGVPSVIEGCDGGELFRWTSQR